MTGVHDYVHQRHTGGAQLRFARTPAIIATTTPTAGTVASYGYQYNNLNQRTRVNREDGSYWLYSYNDRGELVSGKKYWSDNAAVSGAQTEYNFDNIGNRNYAKNGGNQLGTLRQSNYTTNSLNQYSQASVPGAIDVTGTANSAATVTVNNQATARKNDYFYKELAVDNNSGPVYPNINLVGARNNFGAGGEDAVTEKGGHVFLPQAVEAYTHDFDGNVLSDGRWTYEWDGENRLISLEAIPTVPIEAKMRLEFAYDWMGRRIQKNVYGWNVTTGLYQLQSVTKFIYDGWGLLAELDGNNLLLRSQVWSTEGLLLLTNEGGAAYQAGYDGNRNIILLVKANTGTISASYEYDPFGQTLKSVGEYASLNQLRYSSKYTDQETNTVYYGYRSYDPKTGRWLSRDPIEEQGGPNLYAMVGNDLIDFLDPNGLQASTAAKSSCPCCCVENVDLVLNGFFQGGLSLSDYYPDLVGSNISQYPGLAGSDILSDQPNKAGPFVNSKQVGAKMQMVSSVSGKGSMCSMSQHLWVEFETVKGKSTGRNGQNFDDIAPSHRDPSKPPYRQYINGNPSLADPPSVPNLPDTFARKWFTTCVGSGGPAGKTCKNKKCCVKWKLDVRIPTNRDIYVPIGSGTGANITREAKWCEQ